MKEKQEYLDILRKIKKEPESSQRNLSKNLGMSLGKLNYCINSLKKINIIVKYTPKKKIIKFLLLILNKLLLKKKKLLI